MIRWRLLLTPFASRHTVRRSDGGLTVRNYSSYYVFGLRVVHLHRDKS